jgi:hypothetical protein
MDRGTLIFVPLSLKVGIKPILNGYNYKEGVSIMKKHMTETNDFLHEVITWEGISKEDETLANEILHKSQNKVPLLVNCKDGVRYQIRRISGDFWVNDVLFESSFDFEEWIESIVPKVESVVVVNRFSKDLITVIKRTQTRSKKII